MLKIIIGQLSPDEGEVVIAKGKTLGYLAQHQELESLSEERAKCHFLKRRHRVKLKPGRASPLSYDVPGWGALFNGDLQR